MTLVENTPLDGTKIGLDANQDMNQPDGSHPNGIYIVANDRVTEPAIALLNSIRLRDPDVPIILIPFNQDYAQVWNALKQRHQVQLFPDLAFLEQLTADVARIFSRDFLALPNKMRKLVVWFGPLQKFLYIDVDIVVFDQISQGLNYLEDYDFICCDYHHSGRGIQDIFSSVVLEQGILSQSDLQDVFNSGFWGSKKSALSYGKLQEILEECAAHREYFDFSRKTTDQPILNYLVLKTMAKRLNLVRLPEWSAGSWAGSTHFEEHDRILYDGDRRLKYLHWAGTPMGTGGPYRELWQFYRYLGETPPSPALAAPPEPSLIQRFKTILKSVKFKGFLKSK